MEEVSKDKSKKEELNMTDVGGIRAKWKPSDGINWDAIQRMRFMNADAEIDPGDTYSKKWNKENRNAK